MIKILIADSFYLSRSGLFSILSNQPDFKVVCQTLDSTRLMADIQLYQPDVVVLDIHMFSEGSIDSIEDKVTDKSKFLVLTNELTESSEIIRILRAGATGCIQISMGEEYLVQAIRDVASNRSPISPNIAFQLLEYLRNLKEPKIVEEMDCPSLSRREIVVLHLLYEGLPNKIIGNQLNISERTVEAHVRNILKKLNATSRTHAVFLATKKGWLPIHD
jgi:DNA-binding NarL/FixJ family response regulator